MAEKALISNKGHLSYLELNYSSASDGLMVRSSSNNKIA
jgi:hypothetical protein